MSSAEIVDTPAEAREQELEPLIVRDPLEQFLDANGLGEGPVDVERIGEGHSNVTYLLTRGEDRFVLRRPPRGPLPPSAHDVLREARLVGAIEQADVRTPVVLAACDDPEVIGAPFYVMRFEHGFVITSQVPVHLDSPDERHRICCELVDSLAEMHAVDWRACGL
jgi:aminoglycoside phosphotransferase (APT) family kinase protein